MKKFVVRAENFLTLPPKLAQYGVFYDGKLIEDGFAPNDMGKAKANYLAQRLNNEMEKPR